MLQEERLETDTERLDRTAVWHGFTQMALYDPMVIERGEGNWLIDCQGRRYLDAISSLWCNVHGHRHERINAAIREQLDRVAHVTSLGMGSATAAELAGRLVELTPAGLEHVFFSSDGSSAVEAALKMAFQYWRQTAPPQPERSRFVALGSAYHGDTTGSVSLGGVEHFHRLFAPILFDPLRGPCPDSYRRPEGLGVEQACQFYLDQMERLLREHRGEIVAVVMEPLVQGAAGLIMHPPGFLAGVRRLTHEHDVLLICDEVATGFGRTGRMFACDHEEVAPDILCLGKGLSGGYLPLAATVASHRVWEAFLGEPAENRQFFHGHTFGGNPLAAAAALASLDVFESEQTLERLPAKVEQLSQELAPLAAHPHVGDIRQRGMMVAVELVEDRASQRRFAPAEMRGRSVCRRATEAGVWIRPLGDVIVLMPPLSILESEIELIGQTVRGAIAEEFELG